MRARYDRELSTVDGQLRRAEEAVRALEGQRAGMEDIAQAIRAGLNGSEEVWREVIEGVTVFEEYVDVKVKSVPGTFRVWYTAGGRGKGYTTAIRRWEVV